MAWMQRIFGTNLVSTLAPSASYSSRFFSKSTPYITKVGIPEFVNGIGNGVESHVAKLETEIGDFQKLLVCRTLKLKKLGIPCKHRLDSRRISNWSLDLPLLKSMIDINCLNLFHC